MKTRKISNFKNFTKLTQKGISLIVLIITIIVIIILSTAVILTISSNNPIDEANRARYESDVDSMQAIFTNTVAKIMVQNQGIVSITAGQINTVTSGVTETTGEVVYTVMDAVYEENSSGTIVFDKSANTATTFYTGKQLPVYAAGDTKWYVDADGNISLEVAGMQYGEKISAALKVSADPNLYYGKQVTNYTTGNSTIDSQVEWQIYYADEKNIYLIATDYVANSNLPKAKVNVNGTETEYTLNTNGDYKAHFSNILTAYTGSEDITNARLQALNSSYHKYLTGNKTTSENNNMKAVAYMLDTNIWAKFAGENAEYAIGGPTVEMLMKSYSKKYGVDYRAQVSSTTGYQISKDGGATWANSGSGMLDTTDTQYIISSSEDTLGMWLVSPCAASNNGIAAIYYDGNVDYGDYNNSSLGFRPVVCLSSDITLKAVDGAFEIE